MKKTRDLILDKSFELVYMYGYHGTSISMILDACKIPKGSLYHHFKSKKEIIFAVLKERIAPKIDEFYELKQIKNKTPIETIILNFQKVSKKEELIKYGCPLNRLNQEMGHLDSDFEREIIKIYNHVKQKLTLLLQKQVFKKETDIDSLAEFIMATVWGALSNSPNNSSKQRYISNIEHLVSYLKSL